MHTKETFKNKAATEIKGFQLKVLKLKTKAEKVHAARRDEYTRQITMLVLKIEETKARLKTLDKAQDHT